MEWEWDDAKDATNTEKHGISFAKALHFFTDSEGSRRKTLLIRRAPSSVFGVPEK